MGNARFWKLISSIGTALAGLSTLGQFSDLSSAEKRFLLYGMLLGYVMSSVGKAMETTKPTEP